MSNEKEAYLANLAKYHQELEDFIFSEYGIKTTYSETMSWGYNTTVFYIQSDRGNFVAKLTHPTPEKLIKINKEIALSNKLHNELPTSKYLLNKNGKWTCNYKASRNPPKADKNIVFRISEYVAGTPPFDMNFDILEQAVGFLKKIHSIKISDVVIPTYEDKNYDTFLHGDLTPSNILISFGKICGIVDFEEAMYGPIEYDLSRLAVFSWFRMKENKFSEILDFITQKYDVSANGESVDQKLLKKISLDHAKSHLDNTIMNKEHYENIKDWEHDCDFAQSMLNGITAYLAQI